jgi:hypothetical protein
MVDPAPWVSFVAWSVIAVAIVLAMQWLGMRK